MQNIMKQKKIAIINNINNNTFEYEREVMFSYSSRQVFTTSFMSLKIECQTHSPMQFINTAALCQKRYSPLPTCP